MSIPPKVSIMEPPADADQRLKWLTKWSRVVAVAVVVVSAEARPQFARLAEWRYAINVCVSARQSRNAGISAAVVYIPLE